MTLSTTYYTVINEDPDKSIFYNAINGTYHCPFTLVSKTVGELPMKWAEGGMFFCTHDNISIMPFKGRYLIQGTIPGIADDREAKCPSNTPDARIDLICVEKARTDMIKIDRVYDLCDKSGRREVVTNQILRECDISAIVSGKLWKFSPMINYKFDLTQQAIYAIKHNDRDAFVRYINRGVCLMDELPILGKAHADEYENLANNKTFYPTKYRKTADILRQMRMFRISEEGYIPGEENMLASTEAYEEMLRAMCELFVLYIANVNYLTNTYDPECEEALKESENHFILQTHLQECISRVRPNLVREYVPPPVAQESTKEYTSTVVAQECTIAPPEECIPSVAVEYTSNVIAEEWTPAVILKKKYISNIPKECPPAVISKKEYISSIPKEYTPPQEYPPFPEEFIFRISEENV